MRSWRSCRCIPPRHLTRSKNVWRAKCRRTSLRYPPRVGAAAQPRSRPNAFLTPQQAGPWDIFIIFDVLLRSQGKLLELCGITDYIDRAHLKQQLKAVFVANNWFAGHGR